MRRAWPADKLGDRHVREAAVDAEPLHRGADLVTGGADRRSPEPDVLGDGEVAVQTVAVPEQADSGADRLALGGEIEAEHACRAAHEREQAGAQPQQARLAGAVRALQQDDLAPIDTQRGAGEPGKATDHGNRVVELDDGIAPGAVRPPYRSTRYGSAGPAESLPRRRQ